jgi:hypothetical protein
VLGSERPHAHFGLAPDGTRTQRGFGGELSAVGSSRARQERSASIMRLLAQRAFSSGGAPTFAPKVLLASHRSLTQAGDGSGVVDIAHVASQVAFQHLTFFGRARRIERNETSLARCRNTKESAMHISRQPGRGRLRYWAAFELPKNNPSTKFGTKGAWVAGSLDSYLPPANWLCYRGRHGDSERRDRLESGPRCFSVTGQRGWLGNAHARPHRPGNDYSNWWTDVNDMM